MKMTNHTVDFSFLEKTESVFFDMDHTLVNLDCDVTWKKFLLDKKLASFSTHFWTHYYYMMYRLNRLNQKQFAAFQLKEMKNRSTEYIEELTNEFFHMYVKSNIYSIVYEIIEFLNSHAVSKFLLTATNEALAKPLADHLQLDRMYATKLEVMENRYTGKIIPPFMIKENKAETIKKHASENNLSLSSVCYFGDSLADVPALSIVGYPVAANPDRGLRQTAEKNGWRTIEFY
jgi:HAD superfamily hydrolase (TIGR01490 family)